MNSILFALWFFLPAGIANAAPVIASRLPLLREWNTPLDFGKHFRTKRIFGPHKTWRGLLSGIVIASLVVYTQQLLWQSGAVSILNGQHMDYMSYSPLLLGFLFGFGALFGDAVESFVKRQIDVASGKSWFPFDQLDYIIGGCIATFFVAQLAAQDYVLILLLWFGLHLLFSYIGYRVKLKPEPI